MHDSRNILSDIKDGSKSAFKEFFEDIYPILCVFAENFLRTKDQSKDVAQEALLKFWEKKNEFKNIQGVKGYLYISVRNRCINILKRSKKSEDLESLKELESESFLKKNIINQETFAEVRRAVESLPKRMREIIELSMQGLKNPEIAEQLGISTNSVHTSKKTAYRKLRDALKDKYYLLLFL